LTYATQRGPFRDLEANPRYQASPSSISHQSAEELREEFKAILDQRSTTFESNLTALSERVSQLSAEVGMLKGKVNEAMANKEKDARIRQLELELERLRS
jgi:hypothetical protein